MQLFYISELRENHKSFVFDKNESRHILKVLRKNKGDNINITNGLGLIFKAKISSLNPNKCEVSILEVSHKKHKGYKLHMAVAPTKLNNRFEWFIEKATEIGVDIITPVFCTHSERKRTKEERFKKILNAAAKQAQRSYFPVLKKPMHFKDFIDNKSEEICFIAHCHNSPKQALKHLIPNKKDLLILIGPEGDFSPEEIKMAHDKGFQSVSLGNNRLRTETAAIVACHTINLYNE